MRTACPGTGGMRAADSSSGVGTSCSCHKNPPLLYKEGQKKLSNCFEFYYTIGIRKKTERKQSHLKRKNVNRRLTV